AQIVESTSIPVWANGDIVDVASARSMLEVTKCYGLMIGRGALGNVNLFREINNLPLLDELYIIKRHLELAKIYSQSSELSTVHKLRRHLLAYNFGRREDILKAETFADLERTML
ncbi:tRNA-dihydrouridine synthase, partial [bacterium]|nr:tRNA-dihydrouridine synthase [bacterium]